MNAERIQKWGWRVAFRVVGRVIPIRGMRFLAYPIGLILSWLGIRREVALRNLRLAFPVLEERELRRIARASLRNLVTVYLEIPTLRYLSPRAIRKNILIENIELFHAIGKAGALLLSGHVSNWELLAMGAGLQSGKPFAIVVKGQKDFGELERTRRAHGNTTIPLHQSALRASRILADGGVVAMLADQAASGRDHVVEFFGIPTHAFSAPARLALRYRPKVIVGFAVRTSNGNYRVSLRELHYDDLTDTEQGIHDFTTRYMTMLEEVVCTYPEQWVWQHRRWKHTPGVRYEQEVRRK